MDIEERRGVDDIFHYKFWLQASQLIILVKRIRSFPKWSNPNNAVCF